ncbi:MAG: hypothetical protein ACRD0W_16305, partial [Acidimicrobiales bacterium]
MFEYEVSESVAGGGGVDYALVEPLAPGAVDPVRLAALVDGLDAGYGLLDPVEFALVGPEPGVDSAVLFGAFDDVDGIDSKISERAVVAKGRWSRRCWCRHGCRGWRAWRRGRRWPVCSM